MDLNSEKMVYFIVKLDKAVDVLRSSPLNFCASVLKNLK